MFIRKILIAALALSTQATLAHANTSDDLTTKLIVVSRQFQQESVEGQAKLKVVLKELSTLTDEYMTAVATTGETPAAALVDASHQIKKLLYS